MRRAVILCGATSFVMAFLGGLLAFTLVAPSAATAQSGQAQEVRASAFVLVAPDGDTVLARLIPGTGGGNLMLHDADGVRRLAVAGGGRIETFGPDGTTLTFKAGRTIETYSGLVPVNGVLLGPGGSTGTLPD